MPEHLTIPTGKVGLLLLKLGLFGFALASGAPDGRKIGFALGSFGFVLGLFLWGRIWHFFRKPLCRIRLR